ncbi:serine hydrolase domain-containing protein [Arthrobacter sp. NPDC089319]|uniref:serine hydrolase domain-containing protein n=1 Tax=Arthrobacter sp. NPDC089319 TaxID=3155915 RepID=UPI00342B31C5
MNQQLPPVAEVTGTHSGLGAEIREAFSRALARSKGGAQLVVTRNGETLVDLAGGSISQDTPVQVYSVSKLVVAIAAAHAHGHGVLDLDQPLAETWPAFDRDAARTITARMVLNHSSGINAVDKPLSLEDLVAGALDDAVAAQDPHWEPGTEHGYGAFTFGALMSGVFKHSAMTSVQQYVAEHVTGPAGANFWFGAPDGILSTLAPLTFDSPILTEGQVAAMMAGRAIADGSMLPILTDSPGFFSDRRVIQSDWPAMSGISTARDLAKILNAVLGHGTEEPVLSTAELQDMIAEQRHGMDRTLAHVTRYGSGVELAHGHFPYFGGRSFGHQGAGGSVAAVDPDSGLVSVYTSTHTASTVGGSDAALTLLAATRQVVNQW